MNKFCITKIGGYLKDYINVSEGHSYYEEPVIRSGIAMLINHNVFTPEELQKDILRKCSVLLPLNDIEVWAKMPEKE